MQNAAEGSVNEIARKLIVSIYLDSLVGRRFEVIRCIYCGHPIVESQNAVSSIVDNEGVNAGISVGVLIRCKRCKQRYRIVLHERYMELLA